MKTKLGLCPRLSESKKQKTIETGLYQIRINNIPFFVNKKEAIAAEQPLNPIRNRGIKQYSDLGCYKCNGLKPECNSYINPNEFKQKLMLKQIKRGILAA